MASTYDITTDRGKVRFGVGDTSTTAGQYVFEDEEIDYALAASGSVAGAVVRCFRTLLANKSYRVKRYSDAGTSYDDTAQIAALKVALEAAEAELGATALPTANVGMSGLNPGDRSYEEASG